MDLHQVPCVLCLFLLAEQVLSYTLGATNNVSLSGATWLLTQADGALSKPSLREGECDGGSSARGGALLIRHGENPGRLLAEKEV